MISPGCAHCYMFAEQRRYKLDPTVVVRTGTWNAVNKFQKEAVAKGERRLVFTCSWSDFFIDKADDWRTEAWYKIRSTPNLTYQILTKRTERILDHLPGDWGPDGYDNCWMGTTVESPDFLWRIDHLRQVPAKYRLLSIEPLIARIPAIDLTGIHWVIVGGESGPGFRPMDHEWARVIRDACAAQGVAFFFKQSAGMKPGTGDLLDGVEHKCFPDPYFNEHPWHGEVHDEDPAEKVELPVIEQPSSDDTSATVCASPEN